MPAGEYEPRVWVQYPVPYVPVLSNTCTVETVDSEVARNARDKALEESAELVFSHAEVLERPHATPEQRAKAPLCYQLAARIRNLKSTAVL